MTVAIHQPNFFPWLGYFNKITKADLFLFLDNVQFPKTGGSWSNRVKLLINNEARWVTAPVDRNFTGTKQVREMEFLESDIWKNKLIKSLISNYRRHPFFDETMELIEPLILFNNSNIAQYNINVIIKISDCLGLDTKKLMKSSEYMVEGSSNELLIGLTIKVGGDTYMCGGGADGYQNDDLFLQNNIKLLYQSFQHPNYQQFAQKEFIPGLSIIDALMNLGINGVKLIID